MNADRLNVEQPVPSFHVAATLERYEFVRERGSAAV